MESLAFWCRAVVSWWPSCTAIILVSRMIRSTLFVLYGLEVEWKDGEVYQGGEIGSEAGTPCLKFQGLVEKKSHLTGPERARGGGTPGPA